MPYVLDQSKPITVEIEKSALTEAGNFRFLTEASSLGISPARTHTPPSAIRVMQSLGNGCSLSLGNGRPLQYAYSRDDFSHVYRQELGCIELVVLND